MGELFWTLGLRIGRLRYRWGCFFTIFRVTFYASSVDIIATATICVIYCRFLLFITHSMNTRCASRCCSICSLSLGVPIVVVTRVVISIPVVYLRALGTLLATDDSRTSCRSCIAWAADVVSLESIEACDCALCWCLLRSVWLWYPCLLQTFFTLVHAIYRMWLRLVVVATMILAVFHDR